MASRSNECSNAPIVHKRQQKGKKAYADLDQRAMAPFRSETHTHRTGRVRRLHSAKSE